jgi:hypothetical protein
MSLIPVAASRIAVTTILALAGTKCQYKRQNDGSQAGG